MTKPLTVLKCVGPKLVPFFKTVAIFFVLFGEEAGSSLFYCIVKCLPIISLIFFVLLHGMNLTEYYRYSRHILIGLIFSCLGDICLVWKEGYFELGILMFAIAQASYARAFGFRPLYPFAGLAFLVLGCTIYYLLLASLEGSMRILVALYISLISTMAWRAVARVQFFDDLWTWTKLCGCVGAICFLVSDLAIAVDRFVFVVPFAHPIIMLTYYAAQLGISLSVVDSPIEELLQISAPLKED